MRIQLNLDRLASCYYKRKTKKGFWFFKISLGTKLASSKWKEFHGNSDKINELILKTNTSLKENLITYKVMLGLCFILIDWLVLAAGRVHVKLDVQVRVGGKILDIAERRGVLWSWKLDKFLGCHICVVPKHLAATVLGWIFLIFLFSWLRCSQSFFSEN